MAGVPSASAVGAAAEHRHQPAVLPSHGGTKARLLSVMGIGFQYIAGGKQTRGVGNNA